MVSLEEEMRELKLTRDALLMKHEPQDLASLKKEVEELQQEEISLSIENRICKRGLQQLEQRPGEQELSAAYLRQYLIAKRNAFNLEKHWGRFHDRLHELEQQLISSQAELDHRKFLDGTVCDEITAQESELTKRHTAQLIEILEERKAGSCVSLKRALEILKAILTAKQHEPQDLASLKKQLEELKQNSWLTREQEMTSLKQELEESQQEKISPVIENKICQRGLQQLGQRPVEQESSAACLHQHLITAACLHQHLTAACLHQYVTENRNAFDLGKQFALDKWQKTEERFHDRLHELEQQQISTQAELDHRTFLHGTICDEITAQESELTKRDTAQLKEILEEVSQGAPDCQVGQLAVQIKMEEDLVNATNHWHIACQTDTSHIACQTDTSHIACQTDTSQAAS